MKTVIFDVDGTLSDTTHRRNFVEKGERNWAEFNARMGEDVINTAVVELYRTLWDSQKYDIIIVTGRSEAFRKVTEQWLVWNHIPFNRLLMREAKDNRQDSIVKQDILDALKAEGKDILFAVDDRQQVVDMWRRNGITCLQCDEGQF
jgi:phosphoglycolate phosphatase-like HAD superfamily hydrolase